jgi:hypothetical protein
MSVTAQARRYGLAIGIDSVFAVPRGMAIEPASERPQAPPPEAATFANVAISTALMGAVGAVAGGFVGAGLGNGGDDYESVLQGGVVGAWLGGALGSAASSGRPGRALLGSALGVLPAYALLRVGGTGAVLAPAVHGIVTALFTVHAGS